jgi:hypothetical protein
MKNVKWKIVVYALLVLVDIGLNLPKAVLNALTIVLLVLTQPLAANVKKVINFLITPAHGFALQAALVALVNYVTDALEDISMPQESA